MTHIGRCLTKALDSVSLTLIEMDRTTETSLEGGQWSTPVGQVLKS